MSMVVGQGGATDPAPGMSNGGSGGSDGTEGPATWTGVVAGATGNTDLSKSLISFKSLRNDAVVSCWTCEVARRRCCATPVAAAVARRLGGSTAAGSDGCTGRPRALWRADCRTGAILQINMQAFDKHNPTERVHTVYINPSLAMAPYA